MGQRERKAKLVLLLFWAAWLSIVLATNTCDALKALGVLNDSWTFASGNFEFLRSVTAKHGTPDAVNILLFAGVIAWEALAMVLHWRAALRFRAGDPSRIVPAFTVSIGLWGAFILADEIFISYDVEATHFRLLIAGVVSLMAVLLLPDERNPQ
jgi:hypothetical protein